jgi:hypothetical protein
MDPAVEPRGDRKKEPPDDAGYVPPDREMR